VEALLRSLPKEARRSLIPIGAAAASFLEREGSTSTDPRRLAEWLKEFRGIPEPLIRFDLDAVPAHLSAWLAVVKDGHELAQGSDLGLLRRRCASQARANLDDRARDSQPTPWRRFELPAIPDRARLEVDDGYVTVYPTLSEMQGAIHWRYEWTEAEALHAWRAAAVRLARLVLHAPAKDLAKAIGANSALSLAASPYLHGSALVDALLQLVFRRACFRDNDPPRTRDDFERAMERGREHLYETFDEITASALHWFTEARAVRRMLDDPRARSSLAALAQESHEHLRRLLGAESIAALSAENFRQLPRLVKAEERRWQRLLARGGEPPAVMRELNEWSARMHGFETQLAAELRWIPELDELRFWIEEYRVSLYAQELKTLGPVSAARLRVRAAQIDAWLTR